MRRILSLVLVLALLVPLTAQAAPGRTTPVTSEEKPDASKEERRDSDAEREAKTDRENRTKSDRARGKPIIGEFTLSLAQKAVDGDFVDFRYNDTGLQGFEVAGQALFDLQVSAGSPRSGGTDEPKATGAVVRVDTPHYRLRAHDNPEAVTRIDADGLLTLRFAAGTNLTENKHGAVAFQLGNLSGTLRGDDLRVVGGSVVARDGVLLFLHAPRGSFDVHRSDIGEAIAKKRVGAEATFNQEADRLKEDVVSYGNVTLHTVKAEKGNLTLLVDGHGFDGRVVVLNVDGRVIGAQKADDLHVLFDNETIGHASSIQDVLDPDDDGLQAEYYVVFDPVAESFQLLLSVPHYSVHTLSVMTFVQVPPPSVMVGILAGLLVLAASGFVLFRRKD